MGLIGVSEYLDKNQEINRINFSSTQSMYDLLRFLESPKQTFRQVQSTGTFSCLNYPAIITTLVEGFVFQKCLYIGPFNKQGNSWCVTDMEHLCNRAHHLCLELA